MKRKAVVTPNGIKELLRSYDWEKSICEFIWNGFDANATNVEIRFESHDSPLDTIFEIEVSDNGDGIDESELLAKFQPIYESEKARIRAQPKNHSLPHGKSGKGRLTFFTFAESATWITRYRKDGYVRVQTIKIDSESLDSYETGSMEIDCPETGTLVKFKVNQPLSPHDFEHKLMPYLRREFGWFLEMNSPAFKLKVNGIPLDYEKNVLDRETIEIDKGLNDNFFNIRFALWAEKLNSEFSKFYFLNSQGREVWKENTTLNNKGDSFYHSVYIQSSYFDDFLWPEENGVEEQESLFKTKRDEVFRGLFDRVTRFLHQKRSPYIDRYTEKLVSEYEGEGVFPDHGNSPVGQFQNLQIRETVRELYKVQPKIFSSLNITQKKAFVSLLDALIDLGADDRLLEIISKVVDMTPQERDQLSHVLDYANISSITKTISMIKDRYKVVNQLKELIMNDQWGATEFEIQKIVENHFWLFGEEFNLVTAEEPKFEEALRRYLYLFAGDGITRSRPKINHPDKNKEMDIFACRRDVRTNSIENIIVELKHPKINLGRRELGQIDLYLDVILEQAEFTAKNTQWKAFLVGKSFDSSGAVRNAYENASMHGERFLVRNIPSKRAKTYVLQWSDIFSDFECRHNFLLEKLELDKVRILADMEKAKSKADLVYDATRNTAVETATWENVRPPVGSFD